MSLNIIDIDPAFTFGQFEMNRQKIIEQLRTKNLLDKNSEHELPSVIQKIAVISSESAAGYQDFVNQIFDNNYSYTFKVDLFAAAMQGQKTEREVVAALQSAIEEDYDVITIIRGGGSKLDLSAFDNYNIAVQIANSPIPIFTGIGHDIDQTVSDIVANQVLKTPTAVANFIIDHNANFESEIIYYLQLISQRTSKVLDDQKSLLARYEELVKSTPQSILKSKTFELSALENDIFLYAKNHVKNRITSIENTEKILDLLEPKNVLKRGFALVKKGKKYVTRKQQLKTDKKKLSIEFFDGEIEL